jgi:hypothetical protein
MDLPGTREKCEISERILEDRDFLRIFRFFRERGAGIARRRFDKSSPEVLAR